MAGRSWCSVRLLKIDVEGFELQVLQGAQKTLAKHRPVLYVENDRVELSSVLIEFLWGQGYRLW
ncbi:FkbM family methyltransferase [Burkholderia pseudomallei]|nr:FkbM family methyltransferase [Burkholderia pseudomallei]